MEAELVHLREELAEARGLREVAEKERQEAVRLLQEALRKAADNERGRETAVEDGVVNVENSDKDKDIVEHKTENGCEVAPNERLVNGSEKSGNCETNGLENAANDGSVSKCAAVREDMIERESLVSSSSSSFFADTL